MCWPFSRPIFLDTATFCQKFFWHSTDFYWLSTDFYWLLLTSTDSLLTSTDSLLTSGWPYLLEGSYCPEFETINYRATWVGSRDASASKKHLIQVHSTCCIVQRCIRVCSIPLWTLWPGGGLYKGLYNIDYTLYIIHHTLYIIYYILFIIHYSLDNPSLKALTWG